MNCPHCDHEITKLELLALISALPKRPPGRPRSVHSEPRCPCGEMTAKRATARGHKCEAKGSPE